MSILLVLCLVLTMLPMAAFAEGDGNPCTLTETCILEEGHEGECVTGEPEETPAPCTKTEGCTLTEGHEGECELPQMPLAAPAASAPIYLNGSGGSDSADGTAPEKAVKTLDKATELAGEGGTIIVTGNVALSGAGTVNLSGVTVQRGSNFTGDLFTLSGNTTMNLSNVTLDGNKPNTSTGSLIYVTTGAMLNIQEGAKLCNNTATSGGGVYVDNGKLTMSGGSIEGNASEEGGGGIAAWQGTVEITGGEIKNNSAGWGGGVEIWEGTGVLDGGSITGNTSDGNGPGVLLGGGTFTVKKGSITGNTTADGGGAGIYSFWNDTAPAIWIEGGTISGNTTEYGMGDAIYFDNELKLSGSPTISGDVVMNDESTEDIKVEIIGAFTPTQPVTLDDLLWNDNRIFVTYAEGLTPNAADFRFTSEKWGARVEGQNIIRVEMYAVNIWVYPTERYEYFYTMPGEPFDQSKLPSAAVTKTGYSVVGWTERKYDDDTVILGNWDMNAPVTRDLALHPIWKLDPAAVTLTAKDGMVHVVDGKDTLTAAVSHAAPGITYHWQWYKGDELIAEGNNNEQLEVTEAGTYKVVVTASDGKGFSDPVEKSITITEEDHIFPDSWNLNKEDHWKNCTICDTKGHEGPHTYGDWVVTKPATATEEGEQEKVCTACGHTVKSPLPAIGSTTEPGGTTPGTTNSPQPDTTVPKTGDTSNMMFWAILLFVSGAILIGIGFYSQRKFGTKY